jgi:hypothetical protein
MFVALLGGVAAGPARAGNGGSTNVGCTNGSSCQVELENLVTFKGSYSQSVADRGTNGTVSIAPPPCLWIPIGDAISGSQYIIKIFGTDPASAPTTFGINKSVQQADDLLKNPTLGQWYNLPINPAAGAAGEQECLKLPAYYFAVTEAALPAVRLPAKTLAQLAFAGLTLPALETITLNPAGASEVNLPTYLSVTVGNPTAGQLGVANGSVYVAVTATLGGVGATVWAVSSRLSVNAGTSQAVTYGHCPATLTATGATMGTSATAAQISATTANQAIDCGVTYLAPSPAAQYTLSATLKWAACWAPTANAQAVPSYQTCLRRPVPGAGALTGKPATQQVTAQEIQSVTGG